MLTLKLIPTGWIRSGLLALALLATTIVVAPANAQSDADLRRQNQELTTKVKDLEAELDAARKQADTLQKRIAALEAQLLARPAGGGGKVIPPLEPEKLSIDETKPGSSPRNLFNMAVESYKQAVANMPMGTPGDREHVAYMRTIERWEPMCERELRMPIEWTVRLIEGRRDRVAVLQAVDPVTDARLGDPFEVQLSKTMATRIDDLAGGGDPGVLVLKGTSIANISINPGRAMPGSFDNPRFVGPYAEFELSVDPSSITPYRPPPATQPATNPAAPATPAPSK